MSLIDGTNVACDSMNVVPDTTDISGWRSSVDDVNVSYEQYICKVTRRVAPFKV